MLIESPIPANINARIMPLPLFVDQVPAGLPAEVEGFLDDEYDLNELFIPNPNATFFFKISGMAMSGVGVLSGGLIVTDRSLKAKNGSIIVAAYQGALVIRRLDDRGPRILLLSENPKFPTIEVTDQDKFYIWGVVTSVINRLG